MEMLTECGGSLCLDFEEDEHGIAKVSCLVLLVMAQSRKCLKTLLQLYSLICIFRSSVGGK